MFGMWRHILSNPKGDKDALVRAVLVWCGDTEGVPYTPADARLHQALWLYEGDRLKPCPECDGECGEPCAPTTAKAAVAALDRWIENWRTKNRVDELLSR